VVGAQVGPIRAQDGPAAEGVGDHAVEQDRPPSAPDVATRVGMTGTPRQLELEEVPLVEVPRHQARRIVQGAQSAHPVEPVPELAQPPEVVTWGPDHHQVVALPLDRGVPPHPVVEGHRGPGEGLVVEGPVPVHSVQHLGGGGEGHPPGARAHGWHSGSEVVGWSLAVLPVGPAPVTVLTERRPSRVRPLGAGMGARVSAVPAGTRRVGGRHTERLPRWCGAPAALGASTGGRAGRKARDGTGGPWVAPGERLELST
jgi:hypothetical protein